MHVNETKLTRARGSEAFGFFRKPPRPWAA